MRRLLLFLLFSAEFLLWSCQSELSPESKSSLSGSRAFVISAISEGDAPQTRTSLSSDGQVLWGVGDSVCVVCSGVASKFVSTNTAPASRADFTGVLPSGTGIRTVTAYYPWAGVSDHLPSVPSEQTSCGGSFSARMSPMAGIAEVGEGDTFSDMKFFNLASGLKFSLTRDDITRITFRSVAGESVAGKLGVSFGALALAPSVSLSDAGSVNQITITPESSTCFPSGEWLYLIVAPVSLSKGFVIMFETADGMQAAYRKDGPIDFRRSVWKRASGLDSGLDWKAAPESKPLTPNSFRTRNVSVSSGANQTYTLTVSGNDPYFYTWPNAAALDAGLCVLEFEYTANYAVNDFQVFYALKGTVTESTSIRYGALSITEDYQRFTADISALRTLGWGSASSDCLRIDPGDSGNGVLKLRGICVRGKNALERALEDAESPDGPWKEPLMEDKLWLCNGRLQIGVDLDKGGSIFHFSESSTKRNLINHADEGRFLQQSYYGIEDGSSWQGVPWRWNPIQGGGSDGTDARVLEQRMAGDTLVIVSEPVNWGTTGGVCRRIDDARMTSRIYLHPDGYAEIDFTFNYSGDIEHPLHPQEMPAFFCDWDLKNLVYYNGSSPWTGGALTSVVPALLDGVANPNAGVTRTEEWSAYVDDTGWGIGIYTPGTPDMTFYRAGSGPGGAFSASCSYLATLRTFAIQPGMKVNYRVYLKIGTVEQIRQTFRNLAD